MILKKPEILNTINRFLSADKTKQFKQYNNFKSVLKKLKTREIVLKKKLEIEKNTKNLKRIKMELAVIYAKRKKGICAVLQLKKGVSDTVLTDVSPIT